MAISVALQVAGFKSRVVSRELRVATKMYHPQHEASNWAEPARAEFCQKSTPSGSGCPSDGWMGEGIVLEPMQFST